MNCNIPKIIHQTAPEDIKKWHPIWKLCQDSWKNNFPNDEYTYMFWNDDDNDKFIKNYFGEYYQLYCDFDKDIILKVDFVRYAILYKYGGIYADMDFFCNKNFYNKLTSNICIVESPASNESIQNSLMASPPGDKRWLGVLNNCKTYFYNYKFKNPNTRITGSDVIDISGPRLLSSSFELSSISILPVNLFNPYANNFNSNDIYTKHYGTGKWGPNSGNREFDNLRTLDSTIDNYYNNLNENFTLSSINEGYVIINIGNSIENNKSIILNIPIHDVNKLNLCKTKYQDKFFTEKKNNETLSITRLGHNGGWGENHNLYITGNKHIDFDYDNSPYLFDINSLKVYDLNINKLRIGNKNGDGGYVIIPQDNYDLFLSGGISYDISFEEEFINMYNIDCEAFDGSVSGIPTKNNHINFHKKYIGNCNSDTETNLHSFIENSNNIFLKMDIEGGEFPFFSSLTDDQLIKFKQIVIEIHFPNTKEKFDIINRLSKYHYLVHIHGNNFQKKTKLKDLENGNIRIKIKKSVSNNKLIKLSIPLSKNTKFDLINDSAIDYKFEFNITDSNDILCIKRLDKDEGWDKDFWISVNKNNIIKTNSDIEIPDVFECTYVRKSDFDFIPSLNKTPFPSSLCIPNDKSKPDLDLNYFPFVNI